MLTLFCATFLAKNPQGRWGWVPCVEKFRNIVFKGLPIRLTHLTLTGLIISISVIIFIHITPSSGGWPPPQKPALGAEGEKPLIEVVDDL